MLWYYKIKNVQVCLTQAEIWDLWSLKIFSCIVHLGQGAANQRDRGMCKPALLQAAGTIWPSSFGNVTCRETDLQIVIRPC